MLLIVIQYAKNRRCVVKKGNEYREATHHSYVYGKFVFFQR